MTRDYSQFFQVFTEISRAIHSGDNVQSILESIVTQIKELLHAKGCIFWIVDEDNKSINEKFSHGFSYRSLEEVDYKTLNALFDRHEGEVSVIEDARHDPRIPDLERLGKRRVGSITGMFFHIVGHFRGILAVYFHDQRFLKEQELDLIRALGEQGAIALQRAMSYDEKMMQQLRQVVEGLTLAIEAKDEKTHGHSVRVAKFAKLVAKEMRLSQSDVETIYHGGLLHDIGKIGMEDGILERLGILSRKEMDIVKKHPEIGAKITRPLVFLNDVEPLILHHHERYDGSGYPKGLRRAKIPLGARIIAVCDAFETMLEGRKYFEKMSIEDALTNLQAATGSQFDPDVVKGLYRALLNNPEMLSLSETQLKLVANHLDNSRRVSVFNSDIAF